MNFITIESAIDEMCKLAEKEYKRQRQLSSTSDDTLFMSVQVTIYNDFLTLLKRDRKLETSEQLKHIISFLSDALKTGMDNPLKLKGSLDGEIT